MATYSYTQEFSLDYYITLSIGWIIFISAIFIILIDTAKNIAIANLADI